MIALKELCKDFLVPQRDKPKEFGGNIPWCRIEDIEGKYLNGTKSEQYVTEDTVKSMNLKVIPEGAVICSCSASLGVQAILTTPCVTNQTFIGIVPKDELSAEFLYYYLKSKSAFFKKIGTGTTIPYISRKKFEELLIPEVSLDEQACIVNILERVEKTIKLREQEIAYLDMLIKARFVELFGDIKTNSKNWDKVQMKNVVDIRGRVGWKGYKKEDLRESGPLVLGATHLTDSGDLDLSSPVYLSREKYDESPEIVLQRYDLIFTQRGNTIGKVGLVDQDIGEATINPCVLILRPQKVNPIYLKRYFVMDETKDDMWLLNSGSAQPMITQKGIGEYYLMLPPEELQDSFAEFVKQVDKSKFIHESFRG